MYFLHTKIEDKSLNKAKPIAIILRMELKVNLIDFDEQ